MEHVAPAMGRMGTLIENMGDLLSSNTGQDQSTGMYLMPKEFNGTILTNTCDRILSFILQLCIAYISDG